MRIMFNIKVLRFLILTLMGFLFSHGVLEILRKSNIDPLMVVGLLSLKRKTVRSYGVGS